MECGGTGRATVRDATLDPRHGHGWNAGREDGAMDPKWRRRLLGNLFRRTPNYPRDAAGTSAIGHGPRKPSLGSPLIRVLPVHMCNFKLHKYFTCVGFLFIFLSPTVFSRRRPKDSKGGAREMVKHDCSECGKPLPDNWHPVGTRTVQPVCPTCAVKHMRVKSQRRKALADLREKKDAVPQESATA